MTTELNNLLIVEDDKRLNQMMANMLSAEQYIVSSVYDGLTAISHINKQQPDIVLLDMMLPGCDGLQVLQKIAGNFTVIILMITAKNDETLELSALNLGVHDYITKPVRPHLLLARLKALSRLVQTTHTSNNDIITVQDLSININSRELYMGETLLDISEAEYEIMLYFILHPATIINREMLLKDVRKIEYDGIDRSIDMRISSLRKKLKDSKPPYKYIKTVRAKGYILPN